MSTVDRPFEAIVGGLDGLLSGIHPDGRARWRIPFPSGHAGYLYIKDAWLSLDALIGRPESPDILWNYLTTAELRGSIAFVLEQGDHSIHLRADRPVGDIDETAELAVRMPRFVADFDETLKTRPWKKPRVPRTELQSDCPAGTAQGIRDLGRFCSDAGWEFKERNGRVVSISLDVPDCGGRAKVEPAGEAVRIWVELASLDKDTSRASRHAVAVLLLTVAEMIHLVRPLAQASEDRISIVMQTLCDPDVDSRYLNHALCALSVACRLCSAEVEALGEERIAAQYLLTAGLYR